MFDFRPQLRRLHIRSIDDIICIIAQQFQHLPFFFQPCRYSASLRKRMASAGFIVPADQSPVRCFQIEDLEFNTIPSQLFQGIFQILEELAASHIDNKSSLIDALAAGCQVNKALDQCRRHIVDTVVAHIF